MNNAGQIYAHSLGNIAERLNQQTEERKQQSQLASSLRKTLSLIQPDRKEEFNMQDLGTLQGEFTAIGLKQHLAEQQRQEEEHQAKLKAMLMQQQDMQGANQAIWQMTQPGNAELGNYYENGGPLPTARTPSPGELVQALASHGQALNPNADNLLKVLASGQDGEAAFFNPKQIGQAIAITGPDGKPIPGSYIAATGPKQSQIIRDETLGNQRREADFNNRLRLSNLKEGHALLRTFINTREKATTEEDKAYWDGEINALTREMEALNPKRGATPRPAAGSDEDIAARIQGVRNAVDSGAKVKVIAPDGRTGSIPASQLEEALKAGYKRQ